MKKKSAIFLPLVLAALLAIGYDLVLSVVLSWCYSVLTWQSIYRDYENLVVTSKGTPIIQKFNNETWQEVYFTIDRKKLDKKFTKSLKTLLPAELMGLRNFEKIETPLSDALRIQPISDIPNSVNQTDFEEKAPVKYWYFMHDGKREGKGYFAGFESKSKRSIGFLGTRGFSKEVPPRDEWYAMDGRLMGSEYHSFGMLPEFYKCREPNRNSSMSNFPNPEWKTLMISGDALLQIDLETGKTATLLHAPGMISLSYISDNRVQEEKDKDDHSFYLAAVRTAEQIITCDPTGKRVSTFVIPESLRGNYFSFYEIGNDKALIVKEKKYLDLPSRKELIWTDSSGKVLRRTEIALAGQSSRRISEADYWLAAVCTESPLAVLVFGTVLMPLDDVNWMGGGLDFADAMRGTWRKTWLPLGVLIIVSAFLASQCYRRQRRYALPWTWVWMGFVVLFGLPGFLAYLFHRRWAVLENCPNCRNAVPRDRETCAACGQRFPLPERKGIEVFA